MVSPWAKSEETNKRKKWAYDFIGINPLLTIDNGGPQFNLLREKNSILIIQLQKALSE